MVAAPLNTEGSPPNLPRHAAGAVWRRHGQSAIESTRTTHTILGSSTPAHHQVRCHHINHSHPAKHSFYTAAVFIITGRTDTPAVLPDLTHLITQSGDIEPNPGPTSSSTNHHASPRTINILQLNIDGINSKIMQLRSFIHSNNIHVALIQETKLTASKKTPKIPNFSPIRADRQTGGGGGLITYIHNDIQYQHVTKQLRILIPSDNTTELQAVQIKTGPTTQTTLVNVYIPPDTSPTVPPGYSPNLTPLTTLPSCLVLGDFNAKDDSWFQHNQPNTSGAAIAQQLDLFFILNDTNQCTRTPHQAQYATSSPDISFCTPSLSSRCTWQVAQNLSSDHLPILISLHTDLRTLTSNSRHTFTNYKKANWSAFQTATELKFQQLNLGPICNLDHFVSEFNNIITASSKHFVPQGNIKHYNPNFTTEIQQLIKQRNNLRFNTQYPLTEDTATQIHHLNTTINSKIKEQQQHNWSSFVNTLNHTTNIKQLYRTINSITNSNAGHVHTHESLSTPSGIIPSDQTQANLLIKHFSSISHQPTNKSDRQIIRRKHKAILDHDLCPFTPHQTHKIISSLKHSHATGPDLISNIHLKHLGPHGIQSLTNIANFSYRHSVIPHIWKKGKIIVLPKPKKDLTKPASYRPITLLSTPSKVVERLILTLVTPFIPLSPTQHGFRPNHSTTTLLTSLTQRITSNINSRRPATRTLLTAIDISKAFDSVSRPILINKILKTELANNTKRWLANYLTGRQAFVSHRNHNSITLRFPNGVPQGSVLSPTLFNLFLHDLPPPPPSVGISTYADDITITSSHSNINTAQTLLQPYLNQLTHWMTLNRLKTDPAKSTVTLATNYTKEHKHTPTPILNNTNIKHSHNNKILGTTYNTSTTFTTHIAETKAKCTPRLNALRALTGTTFGHSTDTITTIYKRYIRPVIEYASPSWHPCISAKSLQTLQTVQNSALRIATGCLSSTPIDHLHQETLVIPLHHHLDMRGAQFIAAAIINPSHPFHQSATHPNNPRDIIATPATFYSNVLGNINVDLTHPPPHSSSNLKIIKKRIHTNTVKHAINHLKINSVLQQLPPPIKPQNLTRSEQIHLARFRSNHHPSLMSYKNRIDPTIPDSCSSCHLSPHNIQHIMSTCQSLNHQRIKYNITSPKDLWENPGASVHFLRACNLLRERR